MLGRESKTTVSVSKPVDTDSPVTGQWIKMSGNQKTPQLPCKPRQHDANDKRGEGDQHPILDGDGTYNREPIYEPAPT